MSTKYFELGILKLTLLHMLPCWGQVFNRWSIGVQRLPKHAVLFSFYSILKCYAFSLVIKVTYQGGGKRGGTVIGIINK